MEGNYINGKHGVLLNQRVKINIFVVAIVALFVTVLSVYTMVDYAIAAPVKTTTNNANTLKISPVRTDLTIAPGKSGTVTMKVSNLTDAPMVIQSIENDFIAGDEKGTPALILDATKYAPTHSLKRFMVPLKNVTVPAGKIQDITLTINVPANAKAGGYFGAVRFSPVAADGTTSVNLSASAASLILLTVPGDFIEQLNLTDFKIKQNGQLIGDYINSPDHLGLTVRFENKGSLQAAPFGQVYVKQGDKVLYSKDFNQETPRDTILPDSARSWDLPLDKLGTFGQYTIGATFTYGTTNKSVDVSKTIWIIPTSYIIGAIVAVVVLILLIIGLIFFIRSRKHHKLNSQSRRSAGGYRR